MGTPLLMRRRTLDGDVRVVTELDNAMTFTLYSSEFLPAASVETAGTSGAQK